MAQASLLHKSKREVSDAASALLHAAGHTGDLFFQRHESGDWGDSPDWLKGDNNRAFGNERSSEV